MESAINYFYNGTVSGEIYKILNGVNEFDILNIDGTYYLAYDNQTTTCLVSATSLDGLKTSPVSNPVPNGRYPSIQFEDNLWHLWVWEGACTNHYTAATFSGPYTFSDALPLALTDIHVRRFENGFYYAGYKDQTVADRRIGLLVSKAISGPWTNLGHIFNSKANPLFKGEAADPALVEIDGRAYVTFSGWDGSSAPDPQQRILMAEIDMETGRALTAPLVLASPTEDWEKRGGHRKIFNTVFLREAGKPDRIFFAHNATVPGFEAGWGYIEAGSTAAELESGDLARITFDAAARDQASGVVVAPWGSGTLNAGGLSVGPALGGAFGPVALGSVEDFSMLVDFTPTAHPASGSAAQLAYAASRNRAAYPLVGLWQFPDGRIYWEVIPPGAANSVTGFWPTPWPAGLRTRVVVSWEAGQLTGYVNGQVEVSASFNGTLNGFEEWGVGNPQGADFPGNTHQFNGVIHQLIVREGRLTVTDI